MARGAGSKGAYRGTIGETRTERVHYTGPDGTVKTVEVHRGVNAATHEELALRMRESNINDDVNVSVVYHDPALPAFVLVIPTMARHTALVERAELLMQLHDEREYDIPSYVSNFVTVFGAEELTDYLATVKEGASAEVRAAEIEQELVKRRTLLEEDETSFKAEREEFERVVAELERRAEQLENRAEPAEPEPEPDPVPDPEGTPLPRPVPHEDIQTNPFELLSQRQLEQDGIITSSLPPIEVVEAVDADNDATTVGGTTDIAIERWIVSRDPELKYVDDAGVRLAASANPDELEAMLDEVAPVRIQVHKLPTYPLVVIALGVTGGAHDPFCFLFDIAKPGDRAVLNALGREFTFNLHLFDREYIPVQRRTVVANLADNVRFALGAADAHLQSLRKSTRSYNRATLLWSSPEFDKHGLHRPERVLFRRELFEQLDTPGQVREALQMVAHFSKPELEELLVLVWGEPLVDWNRQRGKVVLKAVECGLWPGPDLAQIAISAGAARSRKDLVQRLQTAFARVVERGSDLEPRAVEANLLALQEVAAGVGATSNEPVVSGTIGGDSGPTPGNGGFQEEVLLSALPVDELIGMLKNRKHRRDAAVELAVRGDASAIAPTFEALGEMTRAEAVHVLGNLVKYGDVVTQPLLNGLRSGKSFLRHGCALALGVIKAEVGIEAVCDQLLFEPTEIWRELARSIGEVGPGAVMSLLARLRDQDDQGRERIAWALANIAARGGRGPIETLAQGRDPVAAGVARHALELSELAMHDDEAVRGPTTPRDQTVNRAFSRKFFEAMNRSDAEDDDDDALLLDEADLIDADAEVLDESDLIPT